MAVQRATRAGNKLTLPTYWGRYDLDFSQNCNDELIWLGMYQHPKPQTLVLDDARGGIVQLTVHTNAFPSEQGSVNRVDELYPDHYRVGQKVMRAELMGVRPTQNGLHAPDMDGPQWHIMEQAFKEQETRARQALRNVGAEAFVDRLDRYLLLSIMPMHAGYGIIPLHRLVEKFDSLTDLDAGDLIPAQPLALDWIIRRLPGANNVLGSITHLDCQYWIDMAVAHFQPILSYPSYQDLTSLFMGLVVLKLHVGGMVFDAGFDNGNLIEGAGYKVANRDRLHTYMNAPLLGGVRDRLTIVEVILGALTNPTLREFELTGTRAMQYVEDFWSHPLATLALQLNIGLSLTTLKLSNFRVRDLTAFRVTLGRMQGLIRIHLINLQGGVIVNLFPAAGPPNPNWFHVLQMFAGLQPVGQPLAFPGLIDLNVQGLQAAMVFFNHHTDTGAQTVWMSWNHHAIQNVGIVAGVPEMFMGGAYQIHRQIQQRFINLGRGILAGTPAVPFHPGAPGIRSVPPHQPFVPPIPATLARPAVPDRPGYWFH